MTLLILQYAANKSEDSVKEIQHFLMTEWDEVPWKCHAGRGRYNFSMSINQRRRVDQARGRIIGKEQREISRKRLEIRRALTYERQQWGGFVCNWVLHGAQRVGVCDNAESDFWESRNKMTIPIKSERRPLSTCGWLLKLWLYVA